MLDTLAIPPRLVLRALDDLHTIAEGVQTLPRVEDELSANIAALRVDLLALAELLAPLVRQVSDLDDTAEALEKSMVSLQTMLRRLPGI